MRGLAEAAVEPHLARSALRLVERSRRIRREHREIERRPPPDRRDAQRHDAHRKPGQQAAERGRIGLLERLAHQCLAQRRVRPPRPAAAPTRCGSGRDSACRARRSRRCARPECRPPRSPRSPPCRPPPCALPAPPRRRPSSIRFTVCTMSWRRSASTQPSAEVMPGKRGTSALFRPISRISAPTCSAPPPPNGIATNFCGSWPRSIDTSRIAPAMRASATRTIAAAASSARKAERLADMLGDRAPRGLDVERFQFAAERALRIDAAEHDLRVGQRRPRIALPVAGGARHRARAFRPDLQQAAAIDPGDRAAARADGGDLDHRRADDEAELDRGLRRDRRPCRSRSPTRRTRCRRDRR